MILPKKAQASITSRIKIMADMDIAEKRAPQDGRISATIEGKPYDFRVSTLPCVFGEKIVMRVLDKSSISVGLHRLGLLPQTFDMYENYDLSVHLRDHAGDRADGFRQIARRCIPVLSKVNTGDKNILTIEDPVEYELAGHHAGPCVNIRAGMTFAAGLRSMLRQDPEHHHGRRDARPGNGDDRDRGGADRSPRLLDSPHERRPRR